MALSRPTKPSIPSQDVKLVTIGMPCGYAQRMVLAGLMNEVRRVRHLLKGPQVAVSTRQYLSSPPLVWRAFQRSMVLWLHVSNCCIMHEPSMDACFNLFDYYVSPRRTRRRIVMGSGNRSDGGRRGGRVACGHARHIESLLMGARGTAESGTVGEGGARRTEAGGRRPCREHSRVRGGGEVRLSMMKASSGRGDPSLQAKGLGG
ncbi:hypothetical protein DB88DRAFT_21089 [Papiliotrema laurentii]|uniref:Uncharacterized protein n=1 Tax=Papiliotrema laurentii TaxID=5418 RepID=A0AAD9FW91_PAPLA|nr:hypothetical protein DB88DRAFT_21089 [Papiliotrema laurentii]